MGVCAAMDANILCMGCSYLSELSCISLKHITQKFVSVYRTIGHLLFIKFLHSINNYLMRLLSTAEFCNLLLYFSSKFDVRSCISFSSKCQTQPKFLGFLNLYIVVNAKQMVHVLQMCTQHYSLPEPDSLYQEYKQHGEFQWSYSTVYLLMLALVAFCSDPYISSIKYDVYQYFSNVEV